MDKIIADKFTLLDQYNPTAIARAMAGRARQRRLELNLTQQGLASRAGVSLGSMKRFENNHEISLKHLLLIAMALDALEEFNLLFTKQQYQSIDEALNVTRSKKRRRGRQNGL